ncbi:MAG: hypothetical protein GKR90_09775 [Pseudomonadales bacterium]|nr:hypothetical protein [Pseudomonadales bacterium]
MYPEALPHSLPEEISSGIFVVYGSVQANALARFSRNMVVVQDGNDLTLINPVRMSEEGLEALESLGEIKHILRLAPFHGMDDPFYSDRYQPTFWSFTDGANFQEPAIDQTLQEGGALPFPGAELFVFNCMNQTEGVIYFNRSPGLLVTGDGIQSYATPPHYPHTNLFAKIVLPLIGFPKQTLIGPVWVKRLVSDRDGIKREFERLLDLDFDQLIAAHGTFLKQDAHAEVEAAVKKMFST